MSLIGHVQIRVYAVLRLHWRLAWLALSGAVDGIGVGVGLYGLVAVVSIGVKGSRSTQQVVLVYR